MSLRREIACRLQDTSFSTPRDDLLNRLWCLHAALSIGDETASIYAELPVVRLLQECCSMDISEIHSFLICLYQHIDTCIEPEAWVAFHVGYFILCKECHQLDAVSWFIKSLELAQTDWLQLRVTMALTNWFTVKDNIQQRLEYNTKKIELATKLGKHFVTADALVDRLLVYDRYGDIGQMLKVQYEIKNLLDHEHEAYNWTNRVLDVVLSFAEGKFDGCISKSKGAIDELKKIPDMVNDMATYFNSEITDSRGYIAKSFLGRCILIIGNFGGKAYGMIGDKKRKEREWSIMLRTMYEEYNSSNSFNEREKEMMVLCKKCFENTPKAESTSLEEALMDAQNLLSLSEQTPYNSIYQSWAFVFLAYNLIDSASGKPITDDLVQSTEEFFKKAENAASLQETFFLKPENGVCSEDKKVVPNLVLLQIKLHHGFCLYCLRQLESSESQLQKSIQLFLQLESQTPSSTARIYRLNIVNLSFHILERICWLKDRVDKALIWNEISHSRYLTHHISSHILGGQNSLSDPLNLDDSLASTWKEMKMACELAGSDTVFLVYSWTEPMKEYLAYFFHSTRTICFAHAFGEIMKEFLYRTVKEKIGGMEKIVDMDHLKMLFRQLIRPWRSDLEELSPKRLVIIPSPEFSTIPFAALYDFEKDNGEPYLIQSYEVVCVPSLRLFCQCEDMRQRKKFSNKMRALVVGNPAARRLPDLPHAEAEADDVEGYLCDTDIYETWVLKKEAATQKEVKEKLPECDWVHIATHAVVDEEHPHGAIVLAHSSRRSKGLLGTSGLQQKRTGAVNSAVNESELLEEYEDEEEIEIVELVRGNGVSGDRLSPADVESAKQLRASAVVLSCCQSGLGELTWEGTLGLFRSLHMTGVPTVVCSLWKVNDKSTKTLMQLFYARLFGGDEIATALQQAMVSMINEGYLISQWAPFMVRI